MIIYNNVCLKYFIIKKNIYLHLLNVKLFMINKQLYNIIVSTLHNNFLCTSINILFLNKSYEIVEKM